MKMLVCKDDRGVFADDKGVAKVDSLMLAQFLGKRHDNVIRSIEEILKQDKVNALKSEGIKDKVNQSNLEGNSKSTKFHLMYYTDLRNRRKKCYGITNEGLFDLCWSYKSTKAKSIIQEYFKRLTETSKHAETALKVREQLPVLTDAIKLAKENPKHYHFSNEMNMINKLVLGMPTKEFRKLHNIPENEGIRPFLTDEQLKLLDRLQIIDAGFLALGEEFEDRKEKLEQYLERVGVNV